VGSRRLRLRRHVGREPVLDLLGRETVDTGPSYLDRVVTQPIIINGKAGLRREEKKGGT